ncbi:MAG: chitobiase/beta-hexosaminidase C-terminal domain-containing protein [Eubacteriales bacterium]
MKCKKCGFEIEQDLMYCSSCGQEVQLVPDYTDSIEIHIDDVMVSDEETVDKEEEEEPTIQSVKPKSPFPIRRWILTAISVLLCCVILISVGMITDMYNHSYEYQIDKANALRQQGKYEQAIEHLQKAIQVDSVDPKAKLLLAKTYIDLQWEEDAIEVLLDIIQTGSSLQEVYDNLILIYIQQEAYEEISTLLDEADDVTIKQSYQQYAADSPDYSVTGGEYAEIVPLKLLGNTSGSIYYTIDGSDPTSDSELYETPIFLEEGEYEVKSIYVNAYGVASDIVSQQYYIELAKPYMPEVNVYTGEYTLPEYVSVNVFEGTSVYYTIDGESPTQNSTAYTKPIPMLLGKHQYQFVACNEKGVLSDVVSRTFELEFESVYSAEEAVILVNELIEMKVATGQGDYGGLSGIVSASCNSSVIADGIHYYLVLEYYNDGQGTIHKTGVEYLVDVNAGAISRGTLNSENEYQSIPLTYE